MNDRRVGTFTEGNWTITVTAELVQEFWWTPVSASARHDNGRIQAMGVVAPNFESWQAALEAGREVMRVGLDRE